MKKLKKSFWELNLNPITMMETDYVCGESRGKSNKPVSVNNNYALQIRNYKNEKYNKYKD